MAVEGGSKLIKYLMFFFNFIFFLCGAVIIIVGSLVLTKYNEYVAFTQNLGTAIPIVLIVVGVFVLLTGFLGCCGAIKENYCMVCTFSAIIVIILLFELAGGITAYVLRDDIEKEVKKNMEDLMPTYVNNSEIFDDMQKQLKCCGTDTYSDWYPILGENTVPKSCCVKELNCTKDPNENNVYQKGCYDALIDVLVDNMVLIGIVAIVIALVQIFGVVCACCLMRSIKGEYEVV